MAFMMSSTHTDHFGIFDASTAFDMAAPADSAFLCDLVAEEEEDTKDHLSFAPAATTFAAGSSVNTDEFFCDLTDDDFLSDANLDDTVDASTTPLPQQFQFAPAPVCSALPACPAQQIQINFTFPWVRHAETGAAASTVVHTAADSSPMTSSGATTPCLSDSTGSLNIPEGVFCTMAGPASPSSGAPEHLFSFGDGMLLPEVLNAAQPAAQSKPVRPKPQALAMPHPVNGCTPFGNDNCSYGTDEMMSGMPQLAKKHRGRWTSEEDDALSTAVLSLGGKNWKKIAASLPANNKWTDMQCCHRWHFVLKPGLIKKPWTPLEDEMLRELVALQGPRNWGVIAERMEGRLGKQCRERWCNNLAPEVNKMPWTLDEDKIIWDLQVQIGNQWAEIAKALPGRTHNSVKNRWNGMIRKIDRRAKGSPARRGKNGFISQPWLGDDSMMCAAAVDEPKA